MANVRRPANKLSEPDSGHLQAKHDPIKKTNITSLYFSFPNTIQEPIEEAPRTRYSGQHTDQNSQDLNFQLLKLTQTPQISQNSHLSIYFRYLPLRRHHPVFNTTALVGRYLSHPGKISHRYKPTPACLKKTYSSDSMQNSKSIKNKETKRVKLK